MIFRIALKNCFKNKANLFLISLLVLGCTFLIFFKSTSSSIFHTLDRLLYEGMQGMIWVTKPGYTSDHSFAVERFAFADTTALRQKINADPNVIEIAPQIFFSGKIKFAHESVQKAQSIILYGIDLKTSQRLFKSIDNWLAPNSALPQNETEANVQYTHKDFFTQGKHEPVVLMSNLGSKTQDSFPITVTGYFKQHQPLGFAFIDLHYAQKMLGFKENQILLYSILLKDKSQIETSVAFLKKALGPGYEVQSTNDLQKGIFFYFKQLVQTLDILYLATLICFFSILYITIKSAIRKRATEIFIHSACGILKKRTAAYFALESFILCTTAFSISILLYAFIYFIFNLTGSTFRTGEGNEYYSITTYLSTHYPNILFVFTSTGAVVTFLMLFFSFSKSSFAKSR